MVTHVPEEIIKDDAALVLEQCINSKTKAERVAESLVLADLVGHNSHGISRIPMYFEMISDGVINPENNPRVTNTDRLRAVVDGNSAFGQLVGRKAMLTAKGLVEEYGISIVGVRDATHLGRIGEWMEHVTKEGLFGISFVSTQSGVRTVALPGSADRVLSTNPISMGIPTFNALDFPIILDMATSQVANGKILEKDSNNTSLPQGWAVDADGTPLENPSEFLDGHGAMLPLGGLISGYKGFGLSLVCEIIAATIGNGKVAGQDDPKWFSNVASFIIIDPTFFSKQQKIEDRIRSLVKEIRSSTPSTPLYETGPGMEDDEYLIPGEKEFRSKNMRQKEGIPYPQETLDSIVSIAQDFGISEELSLGNG